MIGSPRVQLAADLRAFFRAFFAALVLALAVDAGSEAGVLVPVIPGVSASLVGDDVVGEVFELLLWRSSSP